MPANFDFIPLYPCKQSDDAAAKVLPEKDQTEQCDIATLKNIRVSHPNSPLIGYLNINSLRNKITEVRVIMENFLPDILAISETKLDNSFPVAQFEVGGYFLPIRKDRNQYGEE